MESRSITVFYYSTIFDYPVIWDVLDLVNLKHLFDLLRGSICHDLLWKIMDIFFIYRKLTCNLNLSKDLGSGMKHVLLSVNNQLYLHN